MSFEKLTICWLRKKMMIPINKMKILIAIIAETLLPKRSFSKKRVSGYNSTEMNSANTSGIKIALPILSRNNINTIARRIKAMRA
jgi:hypothetical protein